MKILKSVWILSLVLFCSTPLRAQWTIDLNETDQHLDSVCAGTGHPLADGTEIRIYHDWNSNGVDALDTLIRVCDDPPNCDAGPAGSVNYNVFWINAATQDPFWAGGFKTINLPLEQSVFCAYAEPSPNRIYLRVCFGSRHYYSEILSPTGGGTYTDIEITTWTCVEAACPGGPPPTPEQFHASDSTHCDTVRLSWRFSSPLDANVDSVFLYRGVDFIGRVRASQTDTVFLDATAPDAQPYTYYAKSRRNLGGGSYVFSAPAQDLGAEFPAPPAITFGTGNLIATDDSCNAVRVSWSYGTNSGADSFIIQRSGVRVGAMRRLTNPGTMTFHHTTTDTARGGYRVCGWNVMCGVANCSVVDSGRAAQPPAVAPTLIGATDGLCNTTRISWNTVSGATGYRVYRYPAGCAGSETFLSTVTAPDTFFNDNSGASGTTYGYKVSATNACGEGPKSACDNGYRVAVPLTVTGVSATDSTSCDTITVTWNNNNTQEDSYKVYRTPTAGGTTDTLATLPADCTRYYDRIGGSLPPVVGTMYNYGVLAHNACGNGPASSLNSGKLKSPAGMPGGVNASDGTNCTGVVITWSNVAREDSFTVFRNDVRIGSTNANVVTFTDLTADTFQTRYGYTIRACNACGCSTSVVDSGYRRIRPGQVAGVFASDTACADVFLRWNDLAREDSFRVLRNNLRIGVTLVNDTDYVDATAVAGTTYGYRVIAINTCGNGDTSIVDNGTRLAPPPVVSSVTATDTRCDSVLLTWPDVAGEDSFQVRRNGTRLDVVLANVLSYGDASAVPGTRYKYEVAAYNACGFVAPTVSDSGGRRAAPPQVSFMYAAEDNCDSVFIGWTAVDNVDTFYVYRNGQRIGSQVGVAQFFIDRTATPGVRYQYYVTAWNVCDSAAASLPDSGMRIEFPSVPANLAATQGLCDRIRVTWDSTAGDVDSFRLIRDGTDSIMVSKDSTGYDDAAAPGVHTYMLKAVSAECGASAASAQAGGERLVPAGVPDSVQATNQRCDSVVIRWAAAPGDVDGYIIYEDGDSLATLAPGDLRYAYQPAVGGYNYTVRAFSNECGYGNISATDGGARLALPTTVTGLSTTVNRCDGVQLQWSAGTGQITGYIVRRDLIALDTVDVLQYVDVPPVGSAQYDVITYSEFCDDSDPTTQVTGTRLPEPVSPDSVAATDDSCNSVTVTWTAGSGTFDGYYLYRNHVRLDTLPVGVQTYVEAPTSGITFMYSVTAWDSICGEAAALDSAQGMRQADASVPQNLAAADACDAVEVSWNTATGAVAEYRLYRNNMPLDTILPPDTTYSDTSAERGVTYTYAVSAFSTGCGETDSSNNDDGMRLPLPVQVLGLTASDDNCAGIQISWSSVVGTEWYRIYRDDALIDSVSGSLRTTTYLDTGVAAGSTHSYEVGSVNICGEGDLSDTTSGTRYDVPDPVTGFSASDSSCVAVYLIWDDVATDTAYVIYRDGSPIDTISANSISYVDTAATPGEHEYVIYAMNECGLSTNSETREGTRIPGVAIVTGVAATSGLCDRIDVTWTDLTNEEGYVVWRDTTRIDTLGANVTTISDLVDPGTYGYQITAFNVCGEGLISAAVVGFRATVPEPTTMQSATMDSCTSVTITWTDVATEQFYRVFRSDTLIATVDSNVTSYRDEPLLPGPYAYQVQPGNYCGNGQVSGVANGRVADVPDTVTNLQASMDNCTTITVTWTNLTDELQYQILRDDTLIGTVAQDTLRFVDTTPAIGTHSYKVRGINICGQGALSVPATGERQGPPTVQPQLAAQDSACGQVTVYWLTVPDAINYTVFVDGDSAICTADTFFVVIANPGPHAITVRPWNECGYGPVSAPKNVFFRSTVLPVTGLTADTMNCLTITLHWTDVANDTGYTILRGVDSLGHVGANVTTYVDSPTNPGTYSYQVKAINQCGYGSLSDPATGRRRGPPAVTTVTASDTSCTNIIVSWTDVADELGYYVFQNAVPVDTVGTDTFSVTLTPPPGAYDYTVQPFNDCGLANLSAPETGHRLTVPPRVIGVAATTNRCDSIVVTWPNVLGETRYVIIRDDDSLTQVNADVVRFADAPTVGVHEYKVRADNQCGNGIPSDSAMGERLIFPLAPVNVAATDTLCGQIRVTWQSGGGDVDSFKVYRNDTLVVSVLADVLTHLEGAAGTHAYKVAAVSIECGDSPDSEPDNGTAHVVALVPGTPVFTAPEICDTIRITWPAAGGEVEGYIVHRDGVAIDTVIPPNYADTTVDDPLPHLYAVAAYNTFCGASALTATAEGAMESLLVPHTDLDDTLYCRDTLMVEFSHCSGVTADSFFLSVEGGPFVFLVAFVPPTDMIELVVPIVDSLARYAENCRIRILSIRGERVDTVISDPFVIDCDLGTEEIATEIPKDFFLDQNYPNPFNPATNIRFGVPRAANVSIEIFDILGRKMATLINGTMQPGIHTVVWDCSACPSGMYIVRMNTGERVMLRKTLLMK